MSIKTLFNPPINQKRKAAIWILQQVTKDLKHKYPVSGIYDADGNKKDVDPTPSYKRYYFKDLQPISGFSKETFLFAIDMLYEKNYISAYYGTKFDYNIIEFEGTHLGHTALIDRVFEDEINNYNNDMAYSYGKWSLPIIAIIISIISLYNSCHKQPAIIQPLLRIDSIPIDPSYKGLKNSSTGSSIQPKTNSTHHDSNHVNVIDTPKKNVKGS